MGSGLSNCRCLDQVLSPPLAEIYHLPKSSPGGRHRIVRFHFEGAIYQSARFLILSSFEPKHQWNRSQQETRCPMALTLLWTAIEKRCEGIHAGNDTPGS